MLQRPAAGIVLSGLAQRRHRSKAKKNVPKSRVRLTNVVKHAWQRGRLGSHEVRHWLRAKKTKAQRELQETSKNEREKQNSNPQGQAGHK